MRADKHQADMPGTAPDRAGLARKLANAPLRPSRPQEPCDQGLFGDGPAQIDLIDYIQQRG
jgi:hypothetical protein